MTTPFTIALGEYGVKGLVGEPDNPRVLRYFHETGNGWVKDDETAWCAAFANWVLWKAGKTGTKSLAARSFLSVGTKTTSPQIGDLVVLWRMTPSSPYGHVGFFVKRENGFVYILGGNQQNAVNIAAFPEYRVLDYRSYA